MMFRVASLGGLFALGLVGAMACEAESEPSAVELDQVESALSSAICDRVFSCRCDQGRRYDRIEMCEQDAAQLALELETLPDQFPGLELTYDAACMGTIIDAYADIGCSPTLPAEDEDACTPPCHYYHGSQQPGQLCEIYGVGVSDCAQGLQCFGGECVDPCDALPDDLLPGEGDACSDEECAGDLVCDFETDRCTALPRAGEPCLWGSVCVEGLFCDAVDPNDPMSERQCFAPRPLAEPCRGHVQCQSGYCPAAYCERPPGNGDACTAEICDKGLDCVDEVCQPADAAICWAYLPGV